MPTKRDWIVLNAKTGNLECRRCGGAEKMMRYIRIPICIAQMKSFGDMHARCKQAPKEEESRADS